MPRKSSQNNLSQASTSSRNSSQLSQSRIDKHFAVATEANLDEQVQKCVRYLVYNAGHNVYIRRTDLQKICGTKGPSNFQQVIEKATKILKNVYGYNVLVCDQGQSAKQAYIVSNGLPHVDYSIDEEPDAKQTQKIVLLLILSHILMTNAAVPEASLHSFLKSLQIDVNVRHPLFGSVKDYIANTLIKQKFLSTETDPVSKKVSYSWGTRAEKEISKQDILNFVCKMYKDCQPKSWAAQYGVASEQRFENDRLTHHQNAMDVDEE